MNSKPRGHAFSLLELMTVVFVIALLGALGAHGFSAMAQSNAVTTGADLIRNVLEEARADAVTQNMTVEVRIYAMAPASGGAAVYDAVQPHWLKANGTTPPAAALAMLSSWVVLDATSLHSPLIATNAQTPTPDASDRALNAQTKVFHFLADGSTDLDPAARWFVTVRPAGQSDPSRFPSNWACIAVDATTGRAQIYRP
jgi:uncharacterized protein (TIGR02596 family)